MCHGWLRLTVSMTYLLEEISCFTRKLAHCNLHKDGSENRHACKTKIPKEEKENILLDSINLMYMFMWNMHSRSYHRSLFNRTAYFRYAIFDAFLHLIAFSIVFVIFNFDIISTSIHYIFFKN